MYLPVDSGSMPLMYVRCDVDCRRRRRAEQWAGAAGKRRDEAPREGKEEAAGNDQSTEAGRC